MATREGRGGCDNGGDCPVKKEADVVAVAYGSQQQEYRTVAMALRVPTSGQADSLTSGGARAGEEDIHFSGQVHSSCYILSSSPCLSVCNPDMLSLVLEGQCM